jgi:voltage-gated potassium channel
MAKLSGMNEYPQLDREPGYESESSFASEDFSDRPQSRSESITFLIMRRMRAPLLLLIVSYAGAAIGLALMPQEGGSPMDFFHAFYVISYTGPTIGFGEIPEAFNIYQRLWVTFSIYLTVTVWVYSLGSIMMLLQEDGLRHSIIESRFEKAVRRIKEPFFLVCGYGDTGRALVSGLEKLRQRTVVVEKRQARINTLTMEGYPLYVPRLCADAGRPVHLIEGGLKNPQCAGVVALTDDNLVNLHVALTAKLLNPGLKTICRVDSHEVAANMSSFGTDYTINPFDTFAMQLHSALNSPSLHLLREWLSGQRHNSLSVPLRPAPARGLWILCSYGRFGKAVYQKLSGERGIRIITIEAAPQSAGYPKGECVVGLGTEARTLQEARIEEAVGIVAGTDDDSNNLSIVMTARQLNPDLFIVLRQNRTANQPLFEAAHADIVMQPSRITANHIRVLLTTPMLIEFMRLGKPRGEMWAKLAVRRLQYILGDEAEPAVWENVVEENTMPALAAAFAQGRIVTFECLIRNPRDRKQILPCLPLLLIRGRERILLPEETETLEVGDKILWCGTHSAKRWMRWTFKDPSVFHYITTGEVEPRGWVFKWWHERRARLT